MDARTERISMGRMRTQTTKTGMSRTWIQKSEQISQSLRAETHLHVHCHYLAKFPALNIKTEKRMVHFSAVHFALFTNCHLKKNKWTGSLRRKS